MDVEVLVNVVTVVFCVIFGLLIFNQILDFAISIMHSKMFDYMRANNLSPTSTKKKLELTLNKLTTTMLLQKNKIGDQKSLRKRRRALKKEANMLTRIDEFHTEEIEKIRQFAEQHKDDEN